MTSQAASVNTQTPAWPSLYDPAIDLLHIEHRDSVQPAGSYLTNANDIFRFTFYWTLIFYLPFFILCGFFAFFNIAFPPSAGADPSRLSRHRYLPLRLRRSRTGESDGDGEGERMDARDDRQEGTSNWVRVRKARRRSGEDEQEFETEHGLGAGSESYPLAYASTFHSCSIRSGASPNSATPLRPNPFPHTRARTSSAAGIYPPTPSIRPMPYFFPDTNDNEDAAGEGAAGDKERQPLASNRTPPRTNPHRTRAAFALLILFTYLASGLLGAVVSAAVVGYVLAGLYSSGGFFMSTWIPPIFALMQTLVGILGLYPSIVEII